MTKKLKFFQIDEVGALIKGSIEKELDEKFLGDY